MALETLIGAVGDPDAAGKLICGSWLKDERLFDIGFSVVKNNDFTCCYCGFKSRPSTQHRAGLMTPVNLGSSDLKPTGKGDICLCPFCASSVAINWSVAPTGSPGKELPAPGVLIYCPWLSQKEISLLALHSVCISAERKVGDSSPLNASVRDVDAAMAALNQEMGIHIPVYRGSDADFARALSLLPTQFYEQRAEIVGAVRWWPNLAYWSEWGRYFYAATFKAVHDRSHELERLLK